MKWVVRGVLVLVAVYAVFFSAVLVAMLRPPEQFGMGHEAPAGAARLGGAAGAADVAVGAGRPLG